MIRKTRHKHHFIYDLDDAIYEEMESDVRIRWFMEHVHQVYVGSEELMHYALKSNKNTTILTTPVVSADSVANSTIHASLRLGFIGCYWGTHFRNMDELVFPAITQLSFPVELVIIGAVKEKERAETIAAFSAYNHVTLVFRDIENWMDEKEINAAMLDWDLGLAPLQDTVVCRAKSAFKVKQYLNLGIPVVSSRIGENRHFVNDGVNGFLFDTREELITILSDFYRKSQEERKILSANAKTSSLEFGLSAIATSWKDGLMVQ